MTLRRDSDCVRPSHSAPQPPQPTCRFVTHASARALIQGARPRRACDCPAAAPPAARTASWEGSPRRGGVPPVPASPRPRGAADAASRRRSRAAATATGVSRVRHPTRAREEGPSAARRLFSSPRGGDPQSPCRGAASPRASCCAPCAWASSASPQRCPRAATPSAATASSSRCKRRSSVALRAAPPCERGRPRALRQPPPRRRRHVAPDRMDRWSSCDRSCACVPIAAQAPPPPPRRPLHFAIWSIPRGLQQRGARVAAH